VEQILEVINAADINQNERILGNNINILSQTKMSIKK
jgi:hypothetical protein